MTTNQTRKLMLHALRARSVKRYGVPYQPHNEDGVAVDFELIGFDYVTMPLHVDPAAGRDASVGVQMELAHLRQRRADFEARQAWMRQVLEDARTAHEQRPIWAGGST